MDGRTGSAAAGAAAGPLPRALSERAVPGDVAAMIRPVTGTTGEGNEAVRPRGAGFERVLAAAALVALLAGAVVLRTAGLSGAVLGPALPRLVGSDPWHHLRQADLLARHFPFRASHDPYALYPDGQTTPVGPLLTWLIAVPAAVAGAGAPAERTVAVVAAILPVLLGAGACLAAFLLGRRYGGTAGGLVAAAAAAALPGQFLQRTALGYSDHHALEALLSAVVALLLVHVLEGGRRRRAGIAAAGLLLGAYLLSWPGGALFVLPLAAFGFLNAHREALAGRDPGPPSRALLVAFLVAGAVAGANLGSAPGIDFGLAALAGAVALTAAAWGVCAALPGGGRPLLAPAVSLGLLAVGAGGLGLLAPGALARLGGAASWFHATGVQETVEEAIPLLGARGAFSLSMAWEHYGFVLPVALAGLVLVAVRWARRGRPADGLLAVWSVVMLLATLGQNRFGYYFTVNAGVLAGALLGPWLGALWRGGGERPLPPLIGRVLWPAAVLCAVVLPRGPAALQLMRHHPGPRDALVAAMDFLREETPAPFPDGPAFTARVLPGEHPRPAWSVLAWWDAGYWVTGIGRRVPVANPTQAGAGTAARLLTAQDEEEALARAGESGVRYVVVDGAIPVLPTRGGDLQGQFGQIARWADLPEERFLETFWQRGGDGTLEPVVVFHPEYYRSLAIRLHLFGGQVYEPADSTWVVEWREGLSPAGADVREIVALRRYRDYDSAEAKVVREGNANLLIAGLDPLRSCVPLAELRGFRRVFAAGGPVALRFPEAIPDVQVFEVTP